MKITYFFISPQYCSTGHAYEDRRDFIWQMVFTGGVELVELTRSNLTDPDTLLSLTLVLDPEVSPV